MCRKIRSWKENFVFDPEYLILVPENYDPGPGELNPGPGEEVKRNRDREGEREKELDIAHSQFSRIQN